MYKNPRFIKSVYSVKELPAEQKPEIILCGRSNVGKSTFINSILNRRNLAKTSSTPGKTRCINYYDIDGRFYLVDLPGYGYAKASESERLKWAKLVNEFISYSKNIAMAFHLIDSRHNPTYLDVKLNQMLILNEIPFKIILNKIDKLNQSELVHAKRKAAEFFPELNFQDDFLIYSSVTKTGKNQVLKVLSQF
ncbi:MAG: YihA family ribosome biogenesis GTP-binding protein [Ignavibacteriaceae bacterium]|nr:YihA family ribosome biogenesis GTP-binding protein [Ignavibacteriaceae bacterium]